MPPGKDVFDVQGAAAQVLAHHAGYAARATPAEPPDQHEHHHQDAYLGITDSTA